MKRFHIGRRTFSIGLVCAGVPFTRPALAQATPLKVKLDWTPWGVHGAIHLAQAKGWLAAANLAVDVQDGAGSTATVQLLGGSQEFDLGHASLSTMMVARGKGLPVKAVASLIRQGDVGCFVPKDSGIRTPADLKGKKIVYTAGSLESPFIDTFLAAGGLKRNDVELVAVSAASKSAVYVSGQADAALSTIPFFLASVADARPSNAIRFADYGLEMPGYGFLAQEVTIQGPKRNAIARYCSIIAAAWTYIYQGNQEEAIDAIVSQRPQARVDRKILRGQIDALQGFMDTPAAKTAPAGSIVVADWDLAVKTMSSVSLVPAEVKGADYVVQGLVQPIQLAAR